MKEATASFRFSVSRETRVIFAIEITIVVINRGRDSIESSATAGHVTWKIARGPPLAGDRIGNFIATRPRY